MLRILWPGDQRDDFVCDLLGSPPLKNLSISPLANIFLWWGGGWGADTFRVVLEFTVDGSCVYTGGVGLTPGCTVHTRHVQQVPVDTHLVHGTVARVRTEAPVVAR